MMNDDKQLRNEERERIWYQCNLIQKLVYDLGEMVPDGHQINGDVGQAYLLIRKVQAEHGLSPDVPMNSDTME